MRRDLSLGDLLREMRSGVTPVAAAEDAEALRERTLSHLRYAQARVSVERDARDRRRRKLMTASLLMPAAAAAAAVLYFPSHRHKGVEKAAAPAALVRAIAGHVDVVHGGLSNETAVGVDTRLQPGDGVHTDSVSRAWISLPSGASVQADVATDLGVALPDSAKSERVELALGHIDVSVPKLGPGRTLSVHTPHALVTVHGTRFAVVVLASGDRGLETRVSVAEGVVAVERDGRTVDLFAGGAWSSAAAEEAAGPRRTADAVAEEMAVRGASPAHRGAGASRAASPAANGTAARIEPPGSSEARFGEATASTLPEENRLMERAMVSSRDGDDRAALGFLDTLLSRFPRSVLRENAQVERFRALRRLGDVSQASHEARRYLAEHPDGMGSDDAKRLAVEVTASPDGAR